MQSEGAISTSWTGASKKRKIHALWHKWVPHLVQKWILAKLKHSFNLSAPSWMYWEDSGKAQHQFPALRLKENVPHPEVQTRHVKLKTPSLAESSNQNLKLWKKCNVQQLADSSPASFFSFLRWEHFKSYQRPAQNL